ncbi:hypothetical protein BJX61DRAFT_539274 [Aspergillus egyptiacus]|nr:hypothetical protein BJX61DRAFT_539274 [Aspergillus egyptiacus]
MTNEEYPIAWICALPIERAAARGMLDEVHDVPVRRHPSDKNTYTLGRIGPHNIVIAGLPSGIYGEALAATVVAHMLLSFPALQMGFVIGIGGAIPSVNHDIRLGDVVVSRPEGTLSGVVQLDQGKSTADAQFVRTGSLNKPPLILLSALAELEAEHEMEDSKVPLYVSQMLERYPKMRAEYSYPGRHNDMLFESGYPHQTAREEGSIPCGACDPDYLVRRHERDSDEPLIHPGIIASSTRGIENSGLRDRIGEEFEAICFQVDDAQFMDDFPCIVIRGICDYCDSHQNKRWQRYAAGTAAAYAKELLSKVPDTSNLDAGRSAAQILRSKITELSETVQALKHRGHLYALPLANGASFDSYANELSARCHPGTRVGILDEINKWAHDPKGKPIFWLSGMAGAGKSTISRTVADSFHQGGQLAASFFFKRGDAFCGNASRFFTTIAAQMALAIPSLGELIFRAVEENPLIADKGVESQFHELILQPIRSLKLTSPVRGLIVVDALDECDDTRHIRTIIRLLTRLSKEEVGLRVLLSTRPETSIQLAFKALSARVYQDLILYGAARQTVDGDIHAVLVHELKKITEDHNRGLATTDGLLPPDWPGDSHTEQLVRIASPSFASAAAVCAFLGDSRFHPEHRLAALLASQSTILTPKLRMTYSPILDQIVASDMTDQDRQYLVNNFRHVVGSLILLVEPLSIQHLAGLLHMSESQVAIPLQSLHAAMIIPKDGSPVQPFHSSFRDFLLDESLRQTSPFHIDRPSTHEFLLERCLNRISQATTRIGARGYNNDDAEHQEEADLQYACKYWVHHLAQARRRIHDGDNVHRFLETHLPLWLEKLRLCTTATPAVDVIQTLLSNVDEV